MDLKLELFLLMFVMYSISSSNNVTWNYYENLFWSFRDLAIRRGQSILNVRTYVDYVKKIYHLELVNPLTKRTLLVIG